MRGNDPPVKRLGGGGGGGARPQHILGWAPPSGGYLFLTLFGPHRHQKVQTGVRWLEIHAAESG